MNNDDTDFGAGAFFCCEGIVAKNEDPENRGRVQCVIPIIDEEDVTEIWARRVCFFVGAPGYGDFHLPEIGTEVVLWGRMGDTNNLFYAPLYNENYPVPSDFRTPAKRGLRNDGDYAVITEGDLILRGGRIIIQADVSVKIIGPGGIFQLTGGE
jgi:hypothetical protein